MLLEYCFNKLHPKSAVVCTVSIFVSSSQCVSNSNNAATLAKMSSSPSVIAPPACDTH